jgi:hypothetical protein
MVSCQHYCCSLVLAIVLIILNLAIVIHLPIIFDCWAEKSKVSCDIYYYLIPYFVLPLISILALSIGVCARIASCVLHIMVAIMGSGLLAFHFLHVEKKFSQDDFLIQLILPACLITGVVVMSIVVALDACCMWLRIKSEQRAKLAGTADPEITKGRKSEKDYNRLDSL